MNPSRPQIRKASLSEAVAAFALFEQARDALAAQKIIQWTSAYPTLEGIRDDIEAGELFVLVDEDQLLGSITLNGHQDPSYTTIDWQLKDPRPFVVHRLVISPQHEGRGFAQQLMSFAETYAREHGHASLRLDAYSQNQRSLQFYKKRGYQHRGWVWFPGRKHRFSCMELVL